MVFASTDAEARQNKDTTSCSSHAGNQSYGQCDRRQVHGRSHLIFKSDKLFLNILSERQELKNPPNAVGSELKTAAPISLCCLGTLFAQLPHSSRTHMIPEYSAPPPSPPREAKNQPASAVSRTRCESLDALWPASAQISVQNYAAPRCLLGHARPACWLF